MPEVEDIPSQVAKLPQVDKPDMEDMEDMEEEAVAAELPVPKEVESHLSFSAGNIRNQLTLY